MQQVFVDTDPSHETAPVVEQPELILLNKLTWSAGLNKGSYGFAKAEAARALRRTASITRLWHKRKFKGECLDGDRHGQGHI